MIYLQWQDLKDLGLETQARKFGLAIWIVMGLKIRSLIVEVIHFIFKTVDITKMLESYARQVFLFTLCFAHNSKGFA